MLNTPNPEEPIDDTEVEITDLDAPAGTGEVPDGYIRWVRLISPRARIWMGIVGIISLTLIVLVVLTSVLHTSQKVARVMVLTPPGNELSLSVVDGRAYASLPDGTVTALRVGDGTLLWHYTSPIPFSPMQLSPIVKYGMVLIALQDGSIDAFHARSGAMIWHATTQ